MSAVWLRPCRRLCSSAALSVADTRKQALILYKQLLQEAQLMPTHDRQQFVKQKVQHEYRQSRAETDPASIQFMLQFADVSVENIRCQREALKLHTTRFQSKGRIRRVSASDQDLVKWVELEANSQNRT